MKKIALLAAIAIGISIPLYVHVAQYYFFLSALLIACLYFGLRRRAITMFDMIVLFAVFIPLQRFRIGPQSLFLRPTELPVIFLSGLWIANRVVSKDIGKKTVPWEYLILAVFIAFSFLSCTKAVYPHISVYRTTILSYLIFFSFLMSDVIRDRKEFFSIIKVLLLVTAVASVIAVAQALIPVMSPFYSVGPATAVGAIKLYRASSGWDNPNYFALFISLVLPITISMLLSREFPNEKRFLKNILVLQIIGLIASLSRNGILTSIAVLMFLLIRYRKYFTTFIIIASTALIVLSIWTFRFNLYQRAPWAYAFSLRVPIERVERYPELILGHRLDAWRANIAMFRKNPVLGVGPYMAGENFPRYRSPRSLFSAGYLEPHSEYISLLSERGIIGFLLFMAFFISLLRRSIRASYSAPDGQMRAVLAGIAGSLFGYAVASTTEATLTQTTFWFIIGLLFAALNIIRRERANVTRK